MRNFLDKNAKSQNKMHLKNNFSKIFISCIDEAVGFMIDMKVYKVLLHVMQKKIQKSQFPINRNAA